MTIITNPVRRTLVLTAGCLADAAGKTFAAMLRSRPGPAAAVAVLQTPTDSNNGSDWATRITEALTSISPPNLSGILAAAGWRLIEPRLLHLLLLVDTAVGAEQQTEIWGQTTVETIYRYLGVETKVTLIWLAQDMDAVAGNCVRAAFSFAPQVLALSPLNEDGLRLPDTQALGTIAAELVWSLTVTSFYQVLAESLAATEDVYTGETPVTTVGIAVWEWSPPTMYEAFCRRWQNEVLACWLAEAEADPTPEVVAAWLQQQGLDREGLATAVADVRFVPRPDYDRIARHLPWPWEMGVHIRRLKDMHQVDADNVEVFKQRAGQQMTVLKQKADEQLAAFLTELLDTQPAAGIDLAARWAWRLQAAWDALYEQLLDESATFDGIDRDLAEERGLLEAHIRELLEVWPGSQWSRWLGYAWRIWRWPEWAWDYWQLRQSGLHLAGLLAQQAARRRQQTVQAAVGRTMSELAHQARQWQGRITEIGDMVKSQQAEEEKQDVGSEKGDDAGDIPDIGAVLYAQLVPDRQREALAAAAAIGGLGRQLRWLDETVLEALGTAAVERFQAVWAVTAVDLLNLCHPTAEQWQTWWQTIGQMAAPLWCYDEAQLSEADRQQYWTGICAMGAGIEHLPVLGRQDEGGFARPQGDPVARIPTADRSRLIVIRIRRGVTLGRLALVEK